MLNEEQFQYNWREIKNGLRNQWGKLTNEELEEVKGNIYEITDIVQAKYGETKHDIRVKIGKLMDSFDNDTDKNIDPDRSSWHRSPVDVVKDFDSDRMPGTDSGGFLEL